MIAVTYSMRPEKGADNQLQSKIGHTIVNALGRSAVVRLSGMAFSFAVGVQLARYLGADNYGRYAIFMSAISVAVVLSQFGLPQLAVREVAKAHLNGYLSVLKNQIYWFSSRALLFSIITALAALSSSSLWLEDGQLATSDEFLILSAIIIIMSLTNVLSAAVRGAQRIISGQLPATLITPGIFSLLLFITWILNSELNTPTALLLNLCALTISCAVAIIFARSIYAGPKSGVDEQPWDASGLLGSARFIWLSELIRVVNNTYPIFVLGALVSNSEVGQYRVAVACMGFISIPVSLFSIVGGPIIARLYAKGDRQKVQSTLSMMALVMFFLMSLVTLLMALFGVWLITLAFGEEYVGSWLPLVILCGSQIIVTFFGISGVFLYIVGEEKLVFNAFLISLPFGFVITIVLIPLLGISGAALGNIVMTVTWHLYCWSKCRDRTGYDFSLLGTTVQSFTLQVREVLNEFRDR
jgi:O-antigen/teichoic acid export membrane protein